MTMAGIDNDRGWIHDEVQGLLPWYVTGTLGPDQRRLVEDHLGGCPLCRAELVRERAMRKAVAAMPIDVELGWADMKRRMAAPRAAARPWTRIARGVADRRRTVHLVLVAQLVLLLGAIVAFRPIAQPASYHALGNAPVAASANALVLFRPDTRQQAVTQLLGQAEARIVDGPTVTGALLLHVAPDRRAATLAQLKARHEIALAEPIDR